MIGSARLASGTEVAALGQGTWRIGDSGSTRQAEIATLQRGVDLDLTLIDTAEMYGDGASERLVAEAIRGRRAAVTLVSKVHPHHAGRSGVPAAIDASLKRLGTDRLDLYLLHWRGGVPLGETVEAFERLKAAGKLVAWGVSNFDVADMEELFAAGGTECATNQILYNVARRGPEFDLLPWMLERSMPAMAYTPIEQGRLPLGGALDEIAAKHRSSIAQIALAFALRSGAVIAIPKASTVAHVEANRAAADLLLDQDDLARIDEAFPPPQRKRPLEML